MTWPTPKFDLPPVRIDGRGVMHVAPADIILSRAGQKELNAMLKATEAA